jgi:ring-1,2-phenylacetyl-CoA epoxidase subunit PaaC
MGHSFKRFAGYLRVRCMVAVADRSALFQLALAHADDALILGHRLSEWSGRAPMLEEDIALSNLGLDLIGQARAFYTYAGAVEGKGRDEDQLAYFRDADGFRNCLLVEQPNGDFAVTMTRQLFHAVFMHLYYQALTTSKVPELAEIAGKAVKEMAYHVRHASEWVIRLGDGTAESHARMCEALADLWSYTGELFELAEGESQLLAAGSVPDRGALRAPWAETIGSVLRQATLPQPSGKVMQTGGRRGRHSEHLGPLLAVMQVVARQHPDATW